ncbi:cyclic diguanylate phosphodiesterase [Trabulsiella odontotermitis]|uniref:cyclic diguanylate phosphodiesterase n=1 Tax=Trabulsiella odontotermitis TaxID=379893 RepID=UPI0024B85876|nr:cyclic diguanylate phosphodiesterase [Trabulsiella odontotermitis]WHP29671.1 cyclic diguanylate phosphodiesterase [Trabulsiella odontotermitis]
MQNAQRAIKQYRQKRIIICLAVALLTLLTTLAVRFISQRSQNQHQLQISAIHAVETIDKVLLPLEKQRAELLQLVGQPCAAVNLTLRTEAAALQTLRSIALVKSGTLYCSSVLGERNVVIHDVVSTLPSDSPQLLLFTDNTLIKGRPLLLQWYPAVNDAGSGVLMSVNIDLLSTLMLEPQKPLINSISLTVKDRHLSDASGVMTALNVPASDQVFSLPSTHFPFTVNLISPGTTELALKSLPTQLPLALILSLLLAGIAWLVTASRMSFSWEINMGVASQEFDVWCQPLLNAADHQCVGVEILLRWDNPRLGPIPPDVFIPLAEEHHLIETLTRYVISETVRQIEVFPKSPLFHVGFNVAASHFVDGKLLRDLNHYWFSAHPHQQLIVELTERNDIHDVDYRLIRELHRKGIKLAIDDFGTGNSSFSWLEKLRPDVLKIDKSFTHAIGTDAVNSTVTDIIIALGQRLKIQLVAEGVETQEQAQYLFLHGVHILQGYLYARPMPLSALPQWLAEYLPRLPSQHEGHPGPSSRSIEDYSSSSS